MTTENIITGKIASVKIKQFGNKIYTWFTLSNEYYSAEGKADIKDGDELAIKYILKPNKSSPNKPYRDVVHFEKLPQGVVTTPPTSTTIESHTDPKTISIVRQTCLKCACETFRIDAQVTIENQVQTILTMAEAFEKWVNRI